MAVRPAGPKPSFEKIAQNLDKAADSLNETAKQQLQHAKGADKTGARGQVVGTGYDATRATADLIKGLSDTAAEVAKGGLVSAGVQGWVSPKVPEGAGYVSKGAARGLSNLAENGERMLGKGDGWTVRQTQADPSAVRFTEQMFGKAGRELQHESDKMNARWNQYTAAITNLVAVPANVSFGAQHAAGATGGLAKAAALTTSASATKIAEFGVRLANVAVQAAEQGLPGAKDLVILTARFAGTAGNVVANPDQAQVQQVVRNALTAYQGELRGLVATHPVLEGCVGTLI